MDLLYIVIIIGSVIAIITLIKNTVLSRLYDANDLASYFTVVPVSQSNNSIEYVVKSILWHQNWEKCNGQRIILVIDNCDVETVDICKKLEEQYSSVLLCYSEQIANIINNFGWI